jgi:hypothetical protein
LIDLSLALQLAHVFIHNKLQMLALTHLCVRIKDSSLVIYSVEENKEANRAILTPFPGNEFVLSIANHRGGWQLVPYVGSLPDRMSFLTEKLAFALIRWH